MSKSLNKVMLIGNLTRDPDQRYTQSGTAITSFSLATNRTWTPTNGGEKQEQVEFHNVVAWAKLGEICGQLLSKGAKVYVSGRLQTRKWKDKSDNDRYTTEVVIDEMIMLSQKPKSDEMRAAEESGIAEPNQPTDDGQQPPDDYNSSQAESIADDIPF